MKNLFARVVGGRNVVSLAVAGLNAIIGNLKAAEDAIHAADLKESERRSKLRKEIGASYSASVKHAEELGRAIRVRQRIEDLLS
jgi:hypothetical protein